MTTALATSALVALLFGASPAEQQAEADRLLQEGAKLGDEDRWDEAIAKFEAADRVFPRAIHACNIGLAHARAGRPDKAYHQLTQCQLRATEKLPPWVQRRLVEVRAALDKGAYAPLELVSTTPGVQVHIAHYGTVVFTPPVTVWLPLGAHQLHAEAAGRVPLDQAFVLDARAPLRRMLELEPAPIVVPDPDKVDPDKTDPDKADPDKTDPDKTDPDKVRPGKPERPPHDGASGARTAAWITTIAGGAALATGAVFYGLAVDAKSEAERYERDDPKFASNVDTFESRRDLAYGFLVGGAVAASVGVVLLLVLPDEAVSVSPAPDRVTLRLRF